jgi:hypothetical protein
MLSDQVAHKEINRKEENMEKSHLLWLQRELFATNGELNVRHGSKAATVHS